MDHDDEKLLDNLTGLLEEFTELSKKPGGITTEELQELMKKENEARTERRNKLPGVRKYFDLLD